MSASVNFAKPIHPFPARMAADIALEEIAAFPPGSLVLDPMAGSGTVLRAAAEQGHRGLGFDLDPLAVLMAKVWTTPVDPEQLRRAARGLATRVRSVRRKESLPWIDEDSETRQFIEYWFGDRQRSDLRKFAHLLSDAEGPIGDALRIASAGSSSPKTVAPRLRGTFPTVVLTGSGTTTISMSFLSS